MRLATIVEPLGVFFSAGCDLKMVSCTGIAPGAVTAVRAGEGQFTVCRPCLERMVLEGEWEMPHARLRPRADALLLDGLGERVVLAKDGPRIGAASAQDWAGGIVRNLAAHAALPSARYLVMLMLPDRGFLWIAASPLQETEPDYAFPIAELGGDDEPAPPRNGADAEAWVARAGERLLRGEARPSGAWWTESGLERTFASERLTLVRDKPARREGAV